MEKSKKVEAGIAIGSFFVAAGLAFTALLIRNDHDFTSGILMMCSQFLLLTATILGIDYKLWTHENFLRHLNNSKSSSKQA